jgi:hypothetical protein
VWADIDRVVALTILSAKEYLGGRGRFPTPFQLFGFDILLDEDLKPWLLEVNYRPSLEFGTEDEKNLKVALLKSVISIAAPLGEVEKLVRSARHTPQECPQTMTLKQKIEKKREQALAESRFAMVLPSANCCWPDLEAALRDMGSDIDEAGDLPALRRITLRKKCVNPTMIIVKPTQQNAKRRNVRRSQIET